MTASSDPTVVFHHELPVPAANLVIYEQIYVLEQWFRRIAYASLVATAGADWKGSLPTDLWGDLRRRLKQLDQRVHLHSDTSTNAVWLLTLDELCTLLSLDNIRSTVARLTGVPVTVILRKLDELREVRNIVGHNQPTTARTQAIVDGLEASLQPAVDSFRAVLIYDEQEASKIALPGDETDDPVVALYTQLEHGNDWSCFQPMLSVRQPFYSLTRLPVFPSPPYLAIRSYLDAVSQIDKNLLATMVNKMGDEFTIVWSMRLAPAAHASIVEWFFAGRETLRWTETPYEAQNPSAVCDPLIWFYENEPPRED